MKSRGNSSKINIKPWPEIRVELKRLKIMCLRVSSMRLFKKITQNKINHKLDKSIFQNK